MNVMKLRNDDVYNGDTLVVTSPFMAKQIGGGEQEFLLGTRVTLERIDDTLVQFSHAAKNYQGDYSYFATLEQWFNLRNQLKYLEDEPVKSKQKEYQPFLKLDRVMSILFNIGVPVLFFVGFVFLLWLISGMFAK